MKKLMQLLLSIAFTTAITSGNGYTYFTNTPDVSRIGGESIYDFPIVSTKKVPVKAILQSAEKKKIAGKSKLPLDRSGGLGVYQHPEYFKRWKLASRGMLSQFPAVQMQASAYEPGPTSCGPHATGRTATGMRADYGVVAVDPRYIPLGTKLYIEGYGFAVAADTGGAIKGNRIDLCYRTVREAMQFGRRIVKVYILGR